MDSMVSFLGVVPHKELLSSYMDGETDVVVLPSVDLGGYAHEGIPVALMEAMACGLPVVSTSTGGIPELLGRGAGIMVPAADPQALAEALESLSLDPELRSQLGAKGRRRIEESFCVERTTHELIASISMTAQRLRPRQTG